MAFQIKAIEQYFPVVLFFTLYKIVLNFESVDEILQFDHSNESYWAVISCGVVYYAVRLCVTMQTKATEQYFPVIVFNNLYKVVITFEYADITWYTQVEYEFGMINTQHRKPRNRCTRSDTWLGSLTNWCFSSNFAGHLVRSAKQWGHDFAWCLRYLTTLIDPTLAIQT